MIKYDYHLHTDFSSDSDANMEDVIKKAINIGLKEIAFTDHWDYIYPDRLFPYQIDYNKYVLHFNKLRDKYRDKINIVFGVEIGIGPHLDRAVSEFAAKFDFDFIIGSVHDIKGEDLYFGNYFSGLSKDDAYNGYFQYFLDSVKSIKEICVLGHMDYISRYGDYDDPKADYFEYKELIDSILTEAVSRGKGIEINTSGYRYGINDVYPHISILKRYKELGGEIITVGSDAHKFQDVAKDFDKAYACLQSAGFKYISIFRNRKPEFVRI